LNLTKNNFKDFSKQKFPIQTMLLAGMIFDKSCFAHNGIAVEGYTSEHAVLMWAPLGCIVNRTFAFKLQPLAA
jgi:hypothetical protein